MLEMPFLFNHRIINLGKFFFLLFYFKYFSFKKVFTKLSMEARGEYEQSVDVGATAVHLEEDSPIVSYHSIMRVL